MTNKNRNSKTDKGSSSAVEVQGSSANRAKWLVALVLVVSGLAADQHFWTPISQGIQHGSYAAMTAFYYQLGRVVSWLALVTLTVYLLSLTIQGKTALGYLRKARDEMYRVTWPTRQEAMKMTLVLVCIVCVVGLFLFAIDFGFMKLITLALQ